MFRLFKKSRAITPVEFTNSLYNKDYFLLPVGEREYRPALNGEFFREPDCYAVVEVLKGGVKIVALCARIEYSLTLEKITINKVGTPYFGYLKDLKELEREINSSAEDLQCFRVEAVVGKRRPEEFSPEYWRGLNKTTQQTKQEQDWMEHIQKGTTIRAVQSCGSSSWSSAW